MRSLAASILLSGLAAAAPTGDIEARAFTGPSDPARFKFYTTPSAQFAGVICDGDTGPDGLTFWYQDLVAPIVGVFNYKTEVFQEYQIPYTKGPSGTPPFVGNVTALQCVFRLGKDGMMYAGAGTRNEVVRVDPRKNPPQIDVFQPPGAQISGNLENFNDYWGSNEAMFFSQVTGDLVTSLDYKTHEYKNYRASTLSGPLGMRTDVHDNLWYTNFLGQYISKIDNKTGVVTEYKNCCPPGSFPEVLRSSTQNQKYLWANAFGLGGFIRIEPDAPDADKFKYFQNPTGLGTFPFENVNDFCGRIWYTSPTFNILVYYTPSTGEWTTVTVPTPEGLPVAGNFEVIMHRGPGHYMWFSIGTLGKLVRYTLDPSCYGDAQ